MEFQVQGSVYVDGEWVSRSADIYRIMARNQQQEDVEMKEPESQLRNEIPDLGVLSTTVIETPFTKFALPANVRHRDLNDVVLVGEDSVQLKEICDYGHLRHIATKSDFNGKIMAARVFSDPRKVHSNVSDRSSPFPYRLRRSVTGNEGITLPPEVIVLTLSSRTLMFLWASQAQTGPSTFRQRTVRLPAAASRFERLGAFLAIDPMCRAIAVAAQEGRFMIYKAKTMETWRSEIRAGRDELPIVDEALIPIEGRIMHMEFLSSGGDRDHSHIVLLFVLVHEGETKVACYDWDLTSDLNETSARKVRSLLVSEERIPSLLIPLSRKPDFLLVYGRYISLCRGVLSGPPDCRPSRIEDSFLTPLRPGASRGVPCWVQWDKASRNPDFTKEAFYVAREDGVVLYVELGAGDTLEIVQAGSWPNPIDTAFACLNVDNSEFARSYPDVLLSGGAGSEGHLCKVGAWPMEYSYALAHSENNAMIVVDSIPNWAPLSDLAITRLSGVRLPYERDRAGIFVTNGEATYGEVSELRRGLKAIVHDSFGGMKGCTGLWIVDHGSRTYNHEGSDTVQHYATFIVTLPPESIVICASRTQLEASANQAELWGTGDSSAWEKVQLSNQDDPDKDHVLREETVSACMWTDQYAVQITRQEARLLRRPALDRADSIVFPNSLLQAVTKSGFPFIAVSFRKGDQTILDIIRIQRDGKIGDLGTRFVTLPCDTTCIELLTFNGTFHVLVGTIDSGIYLYRLIADEQPHLIYETRLESDGANASRIVCESAVLLEFKRNHALVCGTRNGLIICMVLQARDEPDPEKMRDKQYLSYGLASMHVTRMGTAAVHITPNATDSSAAFVACGPDLCCMRYTARNNSPIDLDSIWFVDQQSPAYAQGPVTAIDQLPLSVRTDQVYKNLGGFIFAVSGEQTIFAQMDYDVRRSSDEVPSLSADTSKVIPRKLAIDATPKRLLYLEGAPGKMAVATLVVQERRPPPNGYRTIHSTIKLVHTYERDTEEETEIKQENEPGIIARNPFIAMESPLDDYERVYSMVEWTYVNERNRKHHFVVVGTGITKGTGGESGRRLFLNWGKSEFKVAKVNEYESPVRCIAVFDEKRLVTVVGKKIYVDVWNPDKGKFFEGVSKELPSAGVHLSVQKPYIYVSTSHDSHICYAVHLSELGEGSLGLTQVFTDSRQRSSAHHLVCHLDHSPPAPSSASDDRLANSDAAFVLLSDKECSMTGLHCQREHTNKSTTETLFEACLPRSVIRIHRDDIRPPWRRPCRDLNTSFGRTPGIPIDDIVGACSDGTIYSFSILSQPARRLLRLVQNLIEAKQKRDPALQYSTFKQRSSDIFRLLQNGAEGSQDAKIKARDVDPELQEKGEAAPRFKHVDGDLLTRFFREDGDLVKLVEDGCEADVRTLFNEKVRAFPKEELDVLGDTENEFAWAEKWISEVLMPLL